jgi:hypothetical protein
MLVSAMMGFFWEEGGLFKDQIPGNKTKNEEEGLHQIKISAQKVNNQ